MDNGVRNLDDMVKLTGTRFATFRDNEALATFNLGAGDAACIWRCPAGTSLESFQRMINDFATGAGCTNMGYHLNKDRSTSTESLDQHKYADDFIKASPAFYA